VERLLNKRYGALYPSTFVTYRKDTDESPSKVWSITQDVILSPIVDRQYHLRHPGTSTLWAVATSAYDKKHMWGFTITWSGVVGGQDKLTLAFEDKESSEKWHKALTDAIGNASTRVASTSSESEAPSALAGAPEIDITRDLSTQSSIEGVVPPRKSRAWASVLHINGISVYVEEQDEVGEGGAVMVSAVVRAPPVDVFKVCKC